MLSKINTKTIIISLLIALSTVLGLGLLHPTSSAQYPVKVFFLDSTSVQVKQLAAEDFISIPNNSAIFEGDVIKTNGLTEIIFQDGNIIRLNENSEIEIKQIGNIYTPTTININYGQAWINSYKNQINVYVNQVRTIVKNSTCSFTYQDQKFLVQVLKHLSYLEILSPDQNTVWNTLLLPTQSEVSITANNVNENYKLLSSKKLKKQLKLQQITKTKIKENKWLSNNIILDTTLDFDYFSKNTNVILPEATWYKTKIFFEEFNNKITFIKEKNIQNLAHQVLNRFSETINLILLAANQELIENTLSELEYKLLALKELDPKLFQEIIDNQYLAFEHISATDNFYLLYAKLAEWKEKNINTLKEKNNFRLSQAFKFINDLEDLYSLSTDNPILKEKILKTFSNLISEIEITSVSFDQLDNLRNNYYFLLLSKIDKINKQELALNTLLENIHLNLAKKEINEQNLDLKYEILENQLLLADQIIEQTQNFKLANEYLRENNTLANITTIPTQLAFREHLQEFAWVVTQKIENNIFSLKQIQGQDFFDYLQHQKKISNLSSELNQIIPKDYLGDIHALEQSFSKTEIDKEQLISGFKSMGIIITAENIEIISGAKDKIIIYNLQYQNRLIPRIKYNLSEDKIYEITLENNQVISVPFDRYQLLQFFETPSPTEIDLIISGELTTFPTLKKEPETEISKLVKEIVKRELWQYNIEISLNNIFLLDPDGDTVSIKRALIAQTGIIFDFKYVKDLNLAQEVKLIAREEFSFPGNIPIPQLTKTIENKYAQLEKLAAVKTAMVDIFALNQLNLDQENLTPNDDTYTSFDFEKATALYYKYNFSGTYNHELQLFSKLTLAKKEYTDLTFDLLNNTLRNTYIDELLTKNEIAKSDTFQIISSLMNDDRILINNALVSNHKIRFNLDISTKTVQNILIDNEIDLNIPQIDIKDLKDTVEAAIQKAMEEASQAEKEGLDEEGNENEEENEDGNETDLSPEQEPEPTSNLIPKLEPMPELNPMSELNSTPNPDTGGTFDPPDENFFFFEDNL
jgi:hypothetical protein